MTENDDDWAVTCYGVQFTHLSLVSHLVHTTGAPWVCALSLHRYIEGGHTGEEKTYGQPSIVGRGRERTWSSWSWDSTAPRPFTLASVSSTKLVKSFLANLCPDKQLISESEHRYKFAKVWQSLALANFKQTRANFGQTLANLSKLQANSGKLLFVVLPFVIFLVLPFVVFLVLSFAVFLVLPFRLYGQNGRIAAQHSSETKVELAAELNGLWNWVWFKRCGMNLLVFPGTWPVTLSSKGIVIYETHH